MEWTGLDSVSMAISQAKMVEKILGDNKVQKVKVTDESF